MVLAERELTREKRAKNENQSKVEKKDKPATKVVIRRLPPTMTQEEFLNQVSPIPNYNYIYTIKGDNSLGGNAFARVYVNFSNQEDIYIFKEKFDNYIFIDGNGHEYAAVVEYAAFQKVPKRRKQRADPKAATIESDPAYIAFLESLNEQPNQEEKPEYNLNLTSNDTKSDMTTPLLDYLKQRKAERMRVREEKREERRKKDQEKKKLREEDRKKRVEEKKQKSIAQKEAKKEQKERDNEKENKHNSEELTFKDTPNEQEAEPEAGATTTNEVKKEKSEKAQVQKSEKSFRNRNKYEEKKQQKNKLKYDERKEVKSRRDEFRERERDTTHRQGEKKQEQQKTEQQKKVKKYSERREERKNVEASKEEAKRAESKNPHTGDKDQRGETSANRNRSEEDGYVGMGRKHKDSDPRTQRRIRNKDRPAMQIYKPGMLRKKSVDNDKDVVVLAEVAEEKSPQPQEEPSQSAANESEKQPTEE